MSLINDALKRAGAAKPPAGQPPPPGAPMQPVEQQPPRPANPVLYGIMALVALLVIAIGGMVLKSSTDGRAEDESAAPPAMASQAPATRPAAVEPPESAARESEPTQVTASTGVRLAPAVTREPAPEPAGTSAPGPAEQSSGAAVAAAAPAPAQSLPPATREPDIASQAPAMPEPAPMAQAETTSAAETQPAPPESAVQGAAAPAAPAAREFKLQAIYYRMRNPTVLINGKTLRIGQSVDGARLTEIHRYGAELEYQGKPLFLTME